MEPKAQAFKIVRVIAGLFVAAGLIYFLYSDKSPPIVSVLIAVAVVFFLRLKRKSGVFAEDPTLRRLAMVSSRRPLRDLGLAVAALVATLAVTLGIVVGVKNNMLPDNMVTVGVLMVVIFAGIAGVMFFMSGVIARVIHGPPPP